MRGYAWLFEGRWLSVWAVAIGVGYFWCGNLRGCLDPGGGYLCGGYLCGGYLCGGYLCGCLDPDSTTCTTCTTCTPWGGVAPCGVSSAPDGGGRWRVGFGRGKFTTGGPGCQLAIFSHCGKLCRELADCPGVEANLPVEGGVWCAHAECLECAVPAARTPCPGPSRGAERRSSDLRVRLWRSRRMR